MTEDEQARERFEERLYRSSLKQVIEFLNTTLPPLSDSEESVQPVVKEKKPAPAKISKLGIYKVRDHKKKTRALMEEGGDYSSFDTNPTRVKKSLKSSESEGKRKRVNKFSELKYNDTIRKRKELRNTRKK